MDSVKLVCAALGFLAMGSGALAQSHPLTLRMTCNGARQLVTTQGAIVLNTSATTYDRYVGAAGQCVRGEVMEPVWVPTADTSQCPIGYRCVERNRQGRN